MPKSFVISSGDKTYQIDRFEKDWITVYCNTQNIQSFASIDWVVDLLNENKFKYVSESKRYPQMKFRIIDAKNSIDIQTKLFGLGYTWFGVGAKIKDGAKFLLANSNGFITQPIDNEYYTSVNYQEFEVKVERICSFIAIDEKVEVMGVSVDKSKLIEFLEQFK